MRQVFSYLTQRNAFVKVDYPNLIRAYLSSLLIACTSPVIALLLYYITPAVFQIYAYGLLGLFVFSFLYAFILHETIKTKSSKKRKYYRLQAYADFFITFCILFYLAILGILLHENIAGYAIALIYLALVPVFPLGFHRALIIFHILMTVFIFFLFHKNLLFVFLMAGLYGIYILVSLWKYYRISLYLQYWEQKHSLKHNKNKDTVTNLATTTGLMHKGKKIWKLAKKQKSLAAAIVIQIDSLEDYQKLYGENATVSILQNMAHIMKDVTKTQCSILAHTADDQFIACLFDVDKNGIYLTAKRIKHNFDQMYNMKAQSNLLVSGLHPSYTHLSNRNAITVTAGISIAKTSSPQTSMKSLLQKGYESLNFALIHSGDCIAHHTNIL